MFWKRVAAIVVLVSVGVGVLAQDAVEPTSDEVEVIDEIIVTAGDRPGDPVDVDALYEEMLRDMLMTDLDSLQALEDEQQWRAATNKSVKSSSRISWGYDPQDELRMRREYDMSDVEGITTKPATVFRFGF